MEAQGIGLTVWTIAAYYYRGLEKGKCQRNFWLAGIHLTLPANFGSAGPSTYRRNIETPKSKKKFEPFVGTPGLGPKVPSEPSMYLRNFQKGKREKNLGTSTVFCG